MLLTKKFSCFIVLPSCFLLLAIHGRIGHIWWMSILYNYFVFFINYVCRPSICLATIYITKTSILAQPIPFPNIPYKKYQKIKILKLTKSCLVLVVARLVYNIQINICSACHYIHYTFTHSMKILIKKKKIKKIIWDAI